MLQALVPDSPAFTELMKIEQKLDWTLLRKKAEINDALGRSTRIKRTLRVFLSNTVHDQPWQLAKKDAGGENNPAVPATAPPAEGEKAADGDVTMAEGEVKKEGEGEAAKEATTEEKKEDEADAAVPPTVDVNTGKGVAGWVLRIEGRLLDVSWHYRVEGSN